MEADKMANKEKKKDIETYLEQVTVFTEITPTGADQLLEAEEGNIVFIGRETCPYCRRFVGKLSKLAKEHKLQVHYVHSKHPDYTDEIETLREKYDVPTVPGLLYSSESAGLVVKCDSSLEPEEILEIIEVK